MARTLGDDNPLVFPMRSGKAISASTLPKMLQYHRIAAVAHGFRSSFRDWAAEETDHAREVIEVGPVRAAATTDGRVGRSTSEPYRRHPQPDIDATGATRF